MKTLNAPISALLRVLGADETRNRKDDVSSLTKPNYELQKANMAAYHRTR